MKYIEISSHFEIGMYVFRQKLLSETDPSTYGRTQNLGVEMIRYLITNFRLFTFPNTICQKNHFSFNTGTSIYMGAPVAPGRHSDSNSIDLLQKINNISSFYLYLRTSICFHRNL